VISDLLRHLSYNPKTGSIIWVLPRSKNVKAGAEAGSISKKGYRQMTFMGRTLSIHRVAWAMHYGEWPKLCIDHINGDRADNKLENLRDVSSSVNAMNRHKIVCGNRRKFVTGITLHNSGKWMVQLYCHVDKKVKYYGLYQKKCDAAGVAQKILERNREIL